MLEMTNDKTIENLKSIALSDDTTSHEKLGAIDTLGELGAEDALSEIALKSKHNREYTLIVLRKKVLTDKIREHLLER